MREEQRKSSLLDKLRTESEPELEGERRVPEEKKVKHHPAPVWMKPRGPLPPEKKRSVTMKFRVTEGEEEIIQKRMEVSGISVLAAYLRKMAMNGYILQLDLSAIQEVGRLIAKISGNINQIAKKANESGGFTAHDLQEIQSGQKKIYEELRKLYDIFSVLMEKT